MFLAGRGKASTHPAGGNWLLNRSWVDWVVVSSVALLCSYLAAFGLGGEKLGLRFGWLSVRLEQAHDWAKIREGVGG